MKTLTLLLISFLMCMTTFGCLGLKMQVVGDEEIMSTDQVILSMITGIVKAKYHDKIDKVIGYCNEALDLDNDKLNDYIKDKIEEIDCNDSELNGAIKGLLKSLRVEVDMDGGEIRRARAIIESLRDMLEG